LRRRDHSRPNHFARSFPVDRAGCVEHRRRRLPLCADPCLCGAKLDPAARAIATPAPPARPSQGGARSRRLTSLIGLPMSPATIFDIHLVLGYVPWLLFLGTYAWPKLKSLGRVEAQRAIAILHSFRFFGLVFILPGIVSPNLPASFAVFAAYGDLATGILAMLALLAARIRPLFWLFVVAFHLVGATDLLVDYYHAIQSDLPARAGELG